MNDLQRANMWKRISAALFDVILLVIVAVGVAFLLSSMLRYDSYAERFDALQADYEATYRKLYQEANGLTDKQAEAFTFDITAAEYGELDDATRALYDQAWEAFAKDEDAIYLNGMILNLTLIIVTFGLLAAYLVLELLVPLLFGNGQTVGKKIFGLGVMRLDGVRLSPLLLFARTVLGKFTVETMIPVLLVIMLFFNAIGIVGLAVIGGLLLLQIILLVATRARTLIHDLLAQTVVIDFQSQRIFDTPEALLEHKKKLHAEMNADREW